MSESEKPRTSGLGAVTESMSVKSTRWKESGIYQVEITVGELTRIYVVPAEDWPSAENKALELWQEDEGKANEVQP